MSPDDQRLIATRWIERHSKTLAWDQDRVLQRVDLHPQVDEQLDELLELDPSQYWAVILEILRTDQSDAVLSSLGSLVEVALTTRGEGLVQHVESSATREALVRQLLSWVDPSEPNNAVWARLRRVAGSVPW